MKTHNNASRRQFLQYSALGLASAALPFGLGTALAEEMPEIKSSPNPNFNPDVEIEFEARRAFIQILPNGEKTQVQKFYAELKKGPASTLQQLPGNYLGPILNLQQGQKVRVFFNNFLIQPCIIHWHGLHVPQKSDGHPMYSIAPNKQYVYEFEVVNPAGTSFYHSHTHEYTAEQVYRGLSGLIKVTDANEQKLNLPEDEYDLPLVIQDRSFDNGNQLIYVQRMPDRMLGFLGDTILVNGKPNAQFEVKSRAYRFRALNGSNSRIYKLGFDDGTPLVAIGTDGHLLPKPETKSYIMLAPGERVDLWLDFSGRQLGSELTLYSLPYTGVMPHMGMGMMGGMMGGGIKQGSKFAIASFKISEKVSDSPTLPMTLNTFKRFTDVDVDNANNPIPIGLSMGHMSPRINGRTFAMDRVDEQEQVALGSHKKIRIFYEHAGHGRMGMGGMMNMAHPIHLHGQQYQVVSRVYNGNDNDGYGSVKDGFLDNGFKDTVLVMPGEEVDIIKPFEDYKGFFLYHCHNLEHEDLGMMRQFYVG